MSDRFRSHVRTFRGRARKLTRILRHPAYWPALRQGVAAAEEHSDVPFGFSHSMVFDVGASRGQFALFATRRFPDAQIICFEPLPAPRSALQGILGDRVDVRTVALGSTSGRADINVSARDDSSSLLPIGNRQVREFPGTHAEGSLEIIVETLDSAVADIHKVSPCLLKIDVQGLELEVLKGAKETLKRVDESLIECSFVELYEGQALADQVIAFMLGEGHRLLGVYEAVHSPDGSVLQADLLFRRGPAPVAN